MHFAALVIVLLSTFMQLLSAWGERERVDAIFDLVPLDEALGLGLEFGLEQFV